MRKDVKKRTPYKFLFKNSVHEDATTVIESLKLEFYGGGMPIFG